MLLYLTFKRFDEALLIMATLPVALIGGVWLLYLKHALRDRLATGAEATREMVDDSAKVPCSACGPRR